jgi:hypothetical protein
MNQTNNEESEVEMDEDAMIDLAEKVFIRVADRMVQLKLTVP